jgi:hypothetical protein
LVAILSQLGAEPAQSLLRALELVADSRRLETLAEDADQIARLAL